LALDAGSPLHALLALDALTLDAGRALGTLDHALLTLHARGAFGALDNTLLALDALRAFDSRRSFGALDALPFNPGSTLHALNLLRPLDARSALALHLLRALLCTLGAIAALAAVALRAGRSRDRERGE